MYKILFLIALSVQGATLKYTLDNENSKMVINGTSFLHNWETIVGKLQGEGIFLFKNKKVVKILDFYLKVEAESIKSGTESIDEKTHLALRGPNYPIIRATIKKIERINDRVEGLVDIFVGGVTITEPFSVSLSTPKQNSLIIAGEKKLNMKSFKIDPPTVWFFKAGDEVTVSFSLFLKIKEDQGK